MDNINSIDLWAGSYTFLQLSNLAKREKAGVKFLVSDG
jgi:hypothetical protein